MRTNSYFVPTLTEDRNSIVERIIFVIIAYIFHNFDLSFDSMNKEMGRADRLLKLFPLKSSYRLIVDIATVQKGHTVVL